MALHFLESLDEGTVPTVRQMTARALDNPLGVPALKERLAKAKSVAVLVDDSTRPTPVAEILDVLLPFLTQSGCPKDKVTIVVALGTHVPLAREALEARLGKQVVSTYRIVQHNAWQADLVPVHLEDGRVVKINPVVEQAEIKIGVSSILPHPMAGYGGGPKLLMPGICDIDFIRTHHMRRGIHPRSRIGLAKTNPFHEDCMMIARTIGLDLTIDTVYDREGQVANMVAGSLEEAFGAAVGMCYDKLGHRFSEKVDISIVSSYPHTHGIQMYKGLAVPDIVTREGGAILMVAPMVAPVPDAFFRCFNEVKEKSHHDPIPFVVDAMSKGMPFLPDQSAEFNLAMSYAIRRSAMRTVIVCPMLSKETASTLGLEYADSLEAGMDLLKGAYPEARVAVFPTGGLTVPITDWEE